MKRPPSQDLTPLLRALPTDIDAFHAACAAVCDWPSIVETGRAHGVLGLLVHYWRAAGVAVPAAALRAAERHCAVEQLWTWQVRRALDEALARLSAADIRAVALKGPVFADRFYPDAAVRPSIDLDLLILPEELERARVALEALGYLAQVGPSAVYARTYQHHLDFHRPGTPTLELHFRLYAGFGTVIPAGGALERATEIRTATGAPAWRLCPEDEVLYLALHAAGHSYVRLMWLYDLKLLLLAEPLLDWIVVEKRARQLRLQTSLAYTLTVLADRLGVGVPRPQHLGIVPGVRWRLADRLLATVSQPTDRSPRENLESLVFTSLLCDRALDGVRLVGHHTSRALRRRVQRLAPRIAPERWAG
jgi:hypothetical protein